MLNRLDWMHDHMLGVAQIVNANVLWELVEVALQTGASTTTNSVAHACGLPSIFSPHEF